MFNVSEHLKQLRTTKGLSIRALSRHVGISHYTLGAYELGRCGPSFENAYKIARFFRVPLEYLASGSRAYADFNDSRMLELFRTVDQMSEGEREIVSRYLEKFIRNREEWREIRKEAE